MLPPLGVAYTTRLCHHHRGHPSMLAKIHAHARLQLHGVQLHARQVRLTSLTTHMSASITRVHVCVVSSQWPSMLELKQSSFRPKENWTQQRLPSSTLRNGRRKPADCRARMNLKGESEHKRGRAKRACEHDQEGRVRSLLNKSSINDTSSCNTSACLYGLSCLL